MAVLLAGVTVGGCSGEGSGEGSGGGSAPTAATSSGPAGGSAPAASGAAAPGRTATAYPVPASATPEPLPALGTRSHGPFTLVLNGLRRSGTDAVVVAATVTNTSSENELFTGFEEPGFAHRPGADGKGSLATYEFSAVTLTAPGAVTQYQVMRDADGFCACTQGIMSLDRGRSRAVYAYVTAPPGAATVTVTVQGFAPFTGVQVQS